MPIDCSNLPPKLLKAARAHRLVPFVGAGISAQSGFDFPNWRQLLQRLNELALTLGGVSATEETEIRQLLDREQYLMAAEELRFRLPVDEYESFLIDQLDPPDAVPAEVHRQIFRVNPLLIITTNYDRLLEDAFASRYGRAATVLTYRDAAAVQRLLQSGHRSGRPVIFKLHGSIDEVEDVVLSERDYRMLLYENPGYRLVLSAVFVTHVVVFLGFSFGDPELRLLLEQHRVSLKHRSHPDYILLPTGSANSIEQRRLREDFGLQVITYEATEGHPEIHTFVSYLGEVASQPSTDG